MRQSERLQTFIELGTFLRSDSAQPELEQVVRQAFHRNPWFTPANSLTALQAIATNYLNAEALTNWASSYAIEPESPKKVGVVMAGNIPAVGFHDLLCVLISGHHLLAKLSSQDFVLIQYLIQKITEINPAFEEAITIAERLNSADAFIATGSDNTARYFTYYFGRKPHIIRRNRTSVGILMGDERDADLQQLGQDILQYYGLGCRNVSTLLIPDNYPIATLMRALEPLATEYINQNKYVNNYDYNKSIYLVNQIPHYDNGFLLLTENDKLVSPISVVYYQTYQTLSEADAFIRERSEKIQVVAAAAQENGQGWYPASVAFGQTQQPGLSDYADGVDTMAFLSAL
ncbi:acyl-CoA reductase [Nibrella saemangeumensis]|uniref:Acyl-CoA reductase n=1 Tax=Nibrella saemangeumensis TaxID=1084526 RepID=A0ABP8MH07_9BACT